MVVPNRRKALSQARYPNVTLSRSPRHLDVCTFQELYLALAGSDGTATRSKALFALAGEHTRSALQDPSTRDMLPFFFVDDHN